MHTAYVRMMYPEKAEVFIDDCAVKGPKTTHNRMTIPLYYCPKIGGFGSVAGREHHAS